VNSSQILDKCEERNLNERVPHFCWVNLLKFLWEQPRPLLLISH